MPDNNGGYGWDDRIENPNEGGAFVLLPKGKYPFRITKFERGRFDGSTNMPACNVAKLTVDVDGDSLGVATVMENLFLHQKTEWKLCQFFASIGARKHGEPLVMQWNNIVGKRGWCELGTRTNTKKGSKTEGKEFNQIEAFIDPPEGATVGAKQETIPIDDDEPFADQF